MERSGRTARVRKLRRQLPCDCRCLQAGGVCDSCGGKLVQRKDDAPETVKARLEVYHKETEPLKAFYAQRGPPEDCGEPTHCGGEYPGNPSCAGEMRRQ